MWYTGIKQWGGTKEGKQSAINYFYNILNEEICDGVIICVVPSSNAEKIKSGIGRLGERQFRYGYRVF